MKLRGTREDAYSSRLLQARPVLDHIDSQSDIQSPQLRMDGIGYGADRVVVGRRSLRIVEEPTKPNCPHHTPRPLLSSFPLRILLRPRERQLIPRHP